MTRSKTKGPVVTILGQQMRALPDGVLMNHRDALSEEVLFWRGEHAKQAQAMARIQGDLDKSEATVRNQDVELRRLRARVAELESR